MGNHEFCTECHENDFHHGRPCDPEKVAAVKEQERKVQERIEKKKTRSKKLAKFLCMAGLINRGYRYADTDSYGNLEVGDYTENFEEVLDTLNEAAREHLAI